MSSRLALVTGAAAGLARGIAVALARDGFRLAITCRSGGTLPEATLARVREYDVDAFAVATDHAVLEAAAAVVAAVERARGPIDVLVHAAGPMVLRRFVTSGVADYRAMIDGNLGSAVALCAAVLPGMRERRYGRIVLFGMNGSHATIPARGMALYGAAKAGVVTFGRALALEEAQYGITVNVVEPGDIRNKDADRAAALGIPANNPSGHAGSWEDVADAVRFAVRAEGSFLNGMVLGVNGGLPDPHE